MYLSQITHHIVTSQQMCTNMSEQLNNTDDKQIKEFDDHFD